MIGINMEMFFFCVFEKICVQMTALSKDPHSRRSAKTTINAVLCMPGQQMAISLCEETLRACVVMNVVTVFTNSVFVVYTVTISFLKSHTFKALFNSLHFQASLKLSSKHYLMLFNFFASFYCRFVFKQEFDLRFSEKKMIQCRLY